MIAALADAGAALAARTTFDSGLRLARFIWEVDAGLGRTPAAHLEGRPRGPKRVPGGPACLVEAPLLRALRGELGGPLGVRAATGDAVSMIERCADEENGGFCTVYKTHEKLIRPSQDVGTNRSLREFLAGLRPPPARSIALTGRERGSRIATLGLSGIFLARARQIPERSATPPGVDFHLSRGGGLPWSHPGTARAVPELLRDGPE